MTAPVHAVSTAAETMAVSYPDPTARVDLMPPEVLAARGVRSVQRKLLLMLLAVVLAVVAGSAWFRLDSSRAQAELDAELQTVAGLRASQATFAEVPQIASEQSAIDTALAGLMVDDTAWDADIEALRTSAIGEIVLTGVTGNVSEVGQDAGAVVDPAASGGLDLSGDVHIGTMTVTGRAPTYEAVATWVASLSEVDGFLVPFILGSRVALAPDVGIDFVVEVTLGSAVRSNRYAATPPGGATATPAPEATAEGGS